jgi:microsomal dipeptidase-like Zn-dependent dipeptidase
MASHSVSRRLNNISRNKDDEVLKGIAATGGVVQTTAFQSFLDSAKDQRFREEVAAIERNIAARLGVELLADRRQLMLLPVAQRLDYLERIRPVDDAVWARVHELANRPVDVADLVDHIDYMVELMGIDHVGISSDFDGGGGVWGWRDASETFNVTLELVRRGYSEEEIGKLWSGNLLRVMDEVQRIAGEIRAENH